MTGYVSQWESSPQFLPPSSIFHVAKLEGVMKTGNQWEDYIIPGAGRDSSPFTEWELAAQNKQWSELVLSSKQWLYHTCNRYWSTDITHLVWSTDITHLFGLIYWYTDNQCFEIELRPCSDIQYPSLTCWKPSSSPIMSLIMINHQLLLENIM